MPKITISGRAVALTGDPRRGQIVTDQTSLNSLHGIISGEHCADHIDPELVAELGLSGGYLRFVNHPEKGFLVTTVYHCEKKPEKSQIQRLKQQTEEQWSDGIGNSGFDFLEKSALAASFVAMMVSEVPEILEVLPPFCVDAYPDGDRGVSVSWSDNGGYHDAYANDLRRAIKEQQNAAAMAIMGNLMIDGLGGVEKNVDQALSYMEKAAAAGDENGLISLGCRHLYGDGLDQDVNKGVQYLQNGINNGSLLCMTILGEAYKEGKGVDANPPKGVELLRQAAEMGSDVGMAELGDCYEFGIGVPQDFAEAKKWYTKAFEEDFEAVAPAIMRVSGPKKTGLFAKIGRMVTSLFGSKRGDLDVEEAVMMVSDDDPEMAAAVNEAQGTLHRFIEQLKQPKPGDSFSLKVKFQEGPQAEFMWLDNLRFEAPYFYGTLNNDPQFITGVKLGDEHKAHPNDVNDWLIIDANESLDGGFTVKVLQARQG